MEPQPTNGCSRTKEDMFVLIAKHKDSHTTVKEFCKRHDLAQSVFYYWQKKYHTKNNESGSSGGFARLQVEDPQHAAVQQGLFAEVRGIKLYQAVPAAYLKELLIEAYVKP